MEPIEQCINIIKKHCLATHKDCSSCKIYDICEKYFSREPRKWKLESSNMNIEAMLHDLEKRYDIYRSN